jgi:hypothetical protein
MSQGEAIPFPPAEEREQVRIDNEIRKVMDRDMARAYADAGYMPLSRYIELYGSPRPVRR